MAVGARHRRIGFDALLDLRVAEGDRELARVDVDRDLVAVGERCDRSVARRLWRYVAHHQAVRCAGEAPICNQAYSVAQSLANQRRRNREHLTHSWPANRSFASNHYHITRLYAALLHGFEAGLLAVEHTRGSDVPAALVAGELDDAPSGARLPCRIAKPPVGFSGSESGSTTRWPAVSAASAACSPIVRPVTVTASPLSTPGLGGIPRRFDVDLIAVERAHRELSRTLHPNRFVSAAPSERRAALAKAVEVNEAWRVVRDPIRRAEALLRLLGVSVEEGGEPRSAPEFLMEMLEQREALSEARVARDLGSVRGLAASVQTRAKDAELWLSERFAQGDVVQGGAALLAKLGELRYYRRFLDEVNAIEDELAA